MSLDDTVTMTGQIPPEKRREAWRLKRVFFVTPQILTNDIARGVCDGKSIVCLVVDEAHRALGNYAYCTVVKAVRLSLMVFIVFFFPGLTGNICIGRLPQLHVTFVYWPSARHLAVRVLLHLSRE